MTSGFRNRAGTDWDDLFEPEVGGNGVGDPKYRRYDTSIIRYAKRALGSGVAAVEAGRTDGGGDVTTLWAAKGSVSYLNTDGNGKFGFNGISYGQGGGGLTFGDRLRAEFYLYLYANGTYELYHATDNYKDADLWKYNGYLGTNYPAGVLITSGNWAKSPAAGIGASYVVDASISGFGIGWVDYPVVPPSDATRYLQPGSFRGAGTIAVNGGTGIGNGQSLANTLRIGLSLDVTGNGNNYSLRDKNGGLSWYNTGSVNITIRNAANAAISGNGTMTFQNEIRWNSSTWPTVSNGGGGGTGDGGTGGGGAGGGCPVVESIMYDGTTAGEYMVGRDLLVTDPYMSGSNSTTGEVITSEPEMQPCVRVTCADGTVFECSTTAPIPTQAHGFVKAPWLSGERIPTAAAEDLDGENTPFDWSEVVLVEDIGSRMVQKLYVLNRCFWISKDGKRFGLHHNLKNADNNL